MTTRAWFDSQNDGVVGAGDSIHTFVLRFDLFQDYGDRFPFSLVPTCHDFNPSTRTSYTLEVSPRAREMKLSMN